MYCPTCGQQQLTDETRFCSRCGFLLTGIAEVVSNGGILPGSSTASRRSSAKKRGLKQGLFIFLLTFLVVPIASIVTIALNVEPFLVAISAILLIVGGLLRMAYALMFESNIPGDMTIEERLLMGSQARSLKQPSSAALPPRQSLPVSANVAPSAGAWRDTNDLRYQPPGSVTDSTTKLLQESDTQ